MARSTTLAVMASVLTRARPTPSPGEDWAYPNAPVRAGAVVPARNGRLTLTFVLPARNRTKHVWSFWAGVRKRLKAAHAAHARSGGNRLPPAPLLPKARPLGATWALPAKPRHAKRRQDCSADVLDDLPW
ncbi:hypothetical protein [Verrucomicrobium sp. 3C]|uniref:hypothetical protein n=1 Tax=Verrucomicrobium sp. 3C TaxID=1134055 RepID=UPI0003826AE8|nr:hypothetical protein [Verrucomicrobium sp. 3C]